MVGWVYLWNTKQSKAKVCPQLEGGQTQEGALTGGPKTTGFYLQRWRWSVLENWSMCHQLLKLCVIDKSYMLGGGSLGPWMVNLGLLISEGSRSPQQGSKTLLCVTSHSVNISSLGCDSLSTSKPWFSAIKFPSSSLVLTTSRIPLLFPSCVPPLLETL
jgi:hypothetical protein